MHFAELSEDLGTSQQSRWSAHYLKDSNRFRGRFCSWVHAAPYLPYQLNQLMAAARGHQELHTSQSRSSQKETTYLRNSKKGEDTTSFPNKHRLGHIVDVPDILRLTNLAKMFYNLPLVSTGHS